MSASLFDINGVVPLSQTIFLWQGRLPANVEERQPHQANGWSTVLPEYPGRRPDFHLPGTGIPRVLEWTAGGA
jgi:hypothetical protein